MRRNSQLCEVLAYQIVPASELTIAEIEAWLDDVDVVFRCNWNSITRNWRRYGAPVDVLLIGGKAVGFLAGTDVLEIRPDLRKNGYGRLLAQFMINRARNDGDLQLDIGIYPPSAQPFWERMGFTVTPGRRHASSDGIYACINL